MGIALNETPKIASECREGVRVEKPIESLHQGFDVGKGDADVLKGERNPYSEDVLGVEATHGPPPSRIDGRADNAGFADVNDAVGWPVE
jgi:hypothetical protein